MEQMHLKYMGHTLGIMDVMEGKALEGRTNGTQQSINNRACIAECQFQTLYGGNSVVGGQPAQHI
jgi:hypothetical protein